MSLKRRSFLTGAGAVALSAAASPAFAQSVIDEFLNTPRRGDWNNQFDARVSVGDRVASTLPILSQETVFYLEQAISTYQDLVAGGGWPMVPATKKLKLGVIDPDVEVLRRRLMVSGDLAPSAGISPAFDSYVQAALERFQTRHGLPADGVTGRYTFAAMNVSADVRLQQLQTNLVRLRELTAGDLGQ